jgi:hypothetical protein
MPRVIALVAALFGLAALGPAGAQGDVSLDVPELTITVRGEGVHVPQEMAAGRYLVTVENELSEGTAISLVKTPAGHTLAETQQALADPEEAAEWLYEATLRRAQSPSIR